MQFHALDKEKSIRSGRGRAGGGWLTQISKHMILGNQNDFELLSSNIGSLKTVEQAFKIVKENYFYQKFYTQ